MSKISGNLRAGKLKRERAAYLARSLMRICRSAVLPTLAAGTLFAQTGPAPQSGDQTTTIQEVIVTGSRIPVPDNITATSPIAVVSREEVLLQGHTDITDLINNLPQNAITSNDFGNTSNPLSTPGGIATVDLRGLGPQRTLVLIDGKRLGNGDPNTGNTTPAPDIDQIPAALVERIDVVTGGASAVYGSDAMAGVVNFIMRKNFEGIEVDGQYGFNSHSNHDGVVQSEESAVGETPPTGTTNNGYKRDMSLIMGTNVADGAGNVTGYFVYHNQDPVNGSKYDFADCLIYGGVGCDNGSNSNKFTVAGTQNRFTVVGNNFLPWPQAGSVPPATFNSEAYEYQQRQDQRYMGGFMSHLDVNDNVKPYLDFSFMNDRTTEVVAPSALFSGGNPLTADNNYLVNCSNPLLSAQQIGVIQSQGSCTPAQIALDKATPGSQNVDLDIGRRNVEGGGREFTYEHTNFRVVGGVTGKITDAWTYDVYAQYYYTSLFNGNGNYLNYASINSALQVTGTAANPVCVSGGSCVPYNIFKEGGVTAAQLNYLYTPGTAYGTNDEKIVHADVTGDLGKYGIISPLAKDGLGVNIGAEHRFEGLSFAPDGAELAGDLAGAAGASVPINNGYHVREAFVEGAAPIAQDQPWAKDLRVDLGFRYSDYSTAGVTDTYKFEVQYAPTADIRLRASLDKAVRAPNLIELYNPQSYGQQSFIGTDPCAPTVNAAGGLVAATASLADCIHTGVTAAEYGNGSTTSKISQCTANQCGQVIGGNPGLKPESARTWSVGASITPTFLPNFLATVDYYHIAITGEVGTIPGNYLFDQCLLYGTPEDCSQVVRTASGALHGATVAAGGYINQADINTGAALVSGIDIGFAYKYSMGAWGTLLASMNGTYLQHDITTPYPGAQSFDCVHLFGFTCSGTINPVWRHQMRISWDTPWNFLLSAQWRFIGPSSYDNNSTNPSLAGAEEGAYDAAYSRIQGYNYLDLTAVYHVYKGIDVRAGVQNLFDKDPPLLDDQISNESANNTFGAYDTLGRQLFVAFTAKF